MTEEEKDRILKLELKHENVIEKLNQIDDSLQKLNDNISTFTQELVLIKANSHIPSECKTQIIKEVKKEMGESIKNVGRFTLFIGAIIGGIASWLKWGQN